MSTCPPELSEKTASGRQICWSLGGGANNADQRMNNPTGILSGIAASCDQLALVGAACSAKSTGGTTCGSTSPQGCADPDSLYCCSPYNDQLPPNPGGIGCADANDPNYVNPCSGVWPLPDSAWCSKVKEKVPSSFCTYNGIYENQCPHAYSWQFNDSTSTYQCINPDYKITFCPDSSNTDHDSQLDSEDTDSDNDGIPDSSESAGGSLNKNPSTIAANGINDPDSDGIPNELDLDSDGDGIPDHVEAGGENDSDSDGYADNFVDSDSDGHNDEHDPDQTANVLPIPDTDGDGMPDFLDTDSDGDGVSDTNETTGMDVDGDGMHDDSEDMNKDGLADSVHPSTGMPLDFIDTDEDGIFDHLDASDDINFSDCKNCVEGCSLAVRESRNFFSLLILIPAIVLIRRLRRK